MWRSGQSGTKAGAEPGDPASVPALGEPALDDRAQARYAWRVLSVTTLGVLLSGTNTSTLDVALPVVARHFNADATQASWIVLSYMLVNTILILVFGRVADLVGRRRLYIVGLAILTGASVLCGFAPSAYALAGCRALQAVGAAALITNTTALLADAFPRRLLSTGLSFNVTAASAAQVAGPIVGGALASSLGWRAVFWFNVPFGVAGAAWALRTLRPDPPRRTREPFDMVGALLTFTLVGGLVLALAEGGALGWSNSLVVAGAAVFAVSVPAFIVTQRRRRYPMLDLSVFSDRERSMAYASNTLMAIARFAVVLLIALRGAARGAVADMRRRPGWALVLSGFAVVLPFMLITLGELGMLLCQRDRKPVHIPTVAQEVFDVSGAGDTVIATFTLAITAGASPLEAAVFANHAAGIVVGKVGTATVTPEELLASFRK